MNLPRARYLIPTILFIVLSVPPAYFSYVANPTVHPPPAPPLSPNRVSEEVGLPDLTGKTSSAKALVNLTLSTNPTLAFYPTELMISVQIPDLLLADWSVTGAGIQADPDNALEYATGLPSAIMLWWSVSRLATYSLWTAKDTVEFTTEGTVGAWITINWLPKPDLWRLWNFYNATNSIVRRHVATPILVQTPEEVWTLQQTQYNSAMNNSLEWLIVAVSLLGIGLAFIAEGFSEKPHEHRDEQTKNKGAEEPPADTSHYVF